MNVGLVVLISALPGILIALGIGFLDKNKEDPRHLIGLFFLGMAITIPAYAAQELSYTIGLGDTLSIASTLFFAFIIIAFTEEIIKYLAMRYYVMPKPYFDEKMDGIVFCSMLAMGFATLENALYAADLGLETVLVRIFTSVPAHAVFGIIMGYFISRAKFEQANKQRHLILAFAIPFLLHGLFDFFILQGVSENLMGASLLVLLGGLIASVWMIMQFRKTATDVPEPVVDETQEEVIDSDLTTKETSTTTLKPITTPTVETTLPGTDSTTDIPTNSTTITGSSVDPELGYNESLEESIAEIEDELEEMREKLEDDEDDG